MVSDGKLIHASPMGWYTFMGYQVYLTYPSLYKHLHSVIGKWYADVFILPKQMTEV